MNEPQNSEKSRWFLRHPILEAVVALLAAIAANLPPFNDSKVALTIAVIGVLFALGRYGLAEVLKEDRQTQHTELVGQFSPVTRLAALVDLSHKSELGDLRTLVDRYSQIVDPEFFEAKEEVVHGALVRLNVIVQERRTDELSTGAYYKFLLDLLSSVKANETLYAVSTGEAIEWDDSPQEEKFFQANEDIVARGGQVIRYFVYPKAGFLQAKNQNPKVAAHFAGTRLAGFFVDKERLKQTDERLFQAIGQGFLMVDRRIAVVDVFGKQPRGYVTKNRDELDRYWRAIQELKQMASGTPRP